MAAPNRKRFIELGYKWLEQKISPKEKREFESWLDEVEDQPLDMPAGAANDEEFEALLLQKIRQQIGTGRTRRLWPRIAAAAAVLLCCSAGFYFYRAAQQKAANPLTQHDIAPGHNQATLTLAGGRKIIITKDLQGRLAVQGNTLISAGNAITYTHASNDPEKVEYNTLSTAAGEQSPYPLVLADGSKVWLDAASTITYPTAFTGRERLVKITGQAYFEVVHREDQPFRVTFRGQTVEDIGTKFNINAYPDEPLIKTSLLEGAVRVSIGTPAASVELKPGNAAVTSANNTGLQVKHDDTEETFAWKNGDFTFNDEQIQPIMRQLARWYNIEVQYSGSPLPVRYNAKISRFKNISQVLTVLELTKTVHFKIEGRRVSVSQ